MKHKPTPKPEAVNAPVPTVLSTLAPLAATERLLRKPEVMELVGLASSTLYKYIRAGQFPRPLQRVGRINQWRLSEIQAYIDGGYTPPPLETARPSLQLVRKGGKV